MIHEGFVLKDRPGPISTLRDLQGPVGVYRGLRESRDERLGERGVGVGWDLWSKKDEVSVAKDDGETTFEDLTQNDR